jgi:hypothetical protein
LALVVLETQQDQTFLLTVLTQVLVHSQQQLVVVAVVSIIQETAFQVVQAVAHPALQAELIQVEVQLAGKEMQAV